MAFFSTGHLNALRIRKNYLEIDYSPPLEGCKGGLKKESPSHPIRVQIILSAYRLKGIRFERILHPFRFER
jgi:hypothetical protein